MENRLEVYTNNIVKPMQDEIYSLKERVTKSEKEIAHFKQFEKFQQDQNMRNSQILDAV